MTGLFIVGLFLVLVGFVCWGGWRKFFVALGILIVTLVISLGLASE